MNRKAATNVQTANKHMNKCSPYLIIKETHISTILSIRGKQKNNIMSITMWGKDHLLSEKPVKTTVSPGITPWSPAIPLLGAAQT